jgi:hypothetical protein
MNRCFAAIGLALLACMAPSLAQQAEGRTYTPGAFDAIEISGSASVHFTQGPADQVFVAGDAGLQQAIGVEVRNGQLRIKQRGAWKFWDSRKLRIEVTARDLRRVSISGAADFSAATPLRADKLVVSISGAGTARFDQLDVATLDFQVSGSGDGQVAGTAKDLSVRISGRSDLRAEDLKAEHAAVSISGVGDVRVWVRQDLAIAVAGAGKVDYWGAPPNVARNVSGAATITDRGARTASR